MNISEDSTWMDVIIHLAETHLYRPAAEFKMATDTLRGVVQQNATANAGFSYLRFDAHADWEMKISEISQVFTQEDFEEMLEEIIYKPTLMASDFLKTASENEMLVDRLKNSENRRLFLEMGLKALSVEIGTPPENIEQLNQSTKNKTSP